MISLYSHGILGKPSARLDGESESFVSAKAGSARGNLLAQGFKKDKIGLSLVWVVELVAMLSFGGGGGP